MRSSDGPLQALQSDPQFRSLPAADQARIMADGAVTWEGTAGALPTPPTPTVRGALAVRARQLAAQQAQGVGAGGSWDTPPVGPVLPAAPPPLPPNPLPAISQDADAMGPQQSLRELFDAQQARRIPPNLQPQTTPGQMAADAARGFARGAVSVPESLDQQLTGSTAAQRIQALAAPPTVTHAIPQAIINPPEPYVGMTAAPPTVGMRPWQATLTPAAPGLAQRVEDAITGAAATADSYVPPIVRGLTYGPLVDAYRAAQDLAAGNAISLAQPMGFQGSVEGAGEALRQSLPAAVGETAGQLAGFEAAGAPLRAPKAPTRISLIQAARAPYEPPITLDDGTPPPQPAPAAPAPVQAGGKLLALPPAPERQIPAGKANTASPPAVIAAPPVARPLAYQTDPAALNARDWYHGTGTPDLRPEDLDPNMTRIDGLFGHGIYLTDNPDIAGGYAAARSKRTGTPIVYRSGVNVGTVLDLERPMPDDALQHFQRAADAISPEAGEDVTAAAKMPDATGQSVYRAFSDGIKTALDNGDIDHTGVTEILQDLSGDLKRQGYDAYTHIGGKNTGRDPHQVLIMLDPNDHLTGYVGPDGQWVGSGAGRDRQVTRFEPVDFEAERRVPAGARAGSIINPLSLIDRATKMARDDAGARGPDPRHASDYIAGTPEGVEEFARQALNGTAPANRYQYGTVPDHVADAFQVEHGTDVHGWHLSIAADSVRHIDNVHGAASSRLEGNEIPLTPADYAQIPRAVAEGRISFERVKQPGNRMQSRVGRPGAEFHLTLEDGTLIVGKVAQGKKRQLVLQTMRKIKAEDPSPHGDPLSPGGEQESSRPKRFRGTNESSSASLARESGAENPRPGATLDDLIRSEEGQANPIQAFIDAVNWLRAQRGEDAGQHGPNPAPPPEPGPPPDAPARPGAPAAPDPRAMGDHLRENLRQAVDAAVPEDQRQAVDPAVIKAEFDRRIQATEKAAATLHRAGDHGRAAVFEQQAQNLRDARARLDQEHTPIGPTRDPATMQASNYMNPGKWEVLDGGSHDRLMQMTRDVAARFETDPHARRTGDYLEGKARRITDQHIDDLVAKGYQEGRPLTEDEYEAVKNKLADLMPRVVEAEQHANGPLSTDEVAGARAHARQLAKEAEGLIGLLSPSRSDKGRALAYLKRQAQQGFSSDYWASRAQRMHGNNLPTEAIQRLAEILTRGERAQAAGDDAGVRQARIDLARHMATMPQHDLWHGFSEAIRAGLISSPRTLAKVSISHMFHIMGEETAHAIGGAVDSGLSRATGNRTTLVPNAMRIGAAAREALDRGVRESGEILQHGLPLDELAQMHIPRDLNTRFPWLNAYVNGVYRMHGATYHPFKVYNFMRALQDQAHIVANGDPAEAARLLADPTPEMVAEATAAGEFITFSEENGLSRWLGSRKQNLGSAANFAIDRIIPFQHVPLNILRRVIQYSPIGLAHGGAKMVKAIAKGLENLAPEEQRAISMALGRGMVGTPLIAAGYRLGQMGVIAPTRNPDQRRQAQLENMPFDSIRVGDHWYRTDAMSPIGNLLVMGASLAQPEAPWSVGGHEVPGAVQAPLSLGLRVGNEAYNTMMDAPFMQGTASLQDLRENPKHLYRFAGNVLGQAVPTAVSDLSSMIDPHDRATSMDGPRAALDQITRRTPLRLALAERHTATGAPQANPGYGWSLWNPFQPVPDAAAHDPVIAHMLERGVNKPAPPATLPGVIDDDQPRVKVPLTEDERRDIDLRTGQRVAVAVRQLMDDPAYRAQIADPRQEESADRALVNTIAGARREAIADWKDAGGQETIDARAREAAATAGARRLRARVAPTPRATDQPPTPTPQQINLLNRAGSGASARF